jgi:FkbM family methyltransferase
MRIYFDVGAHNGLDGFNALESNKYDKCYAFEIDKRMIQHILSNSKIYGDRYLLTNKAVGSKRGNLLFKSFKKTDVGSLHELDINSIQGRGDAFDVVDKYNVDIITLFDFCKENNIDRIDYLHIDTQGNDYEVILGLGDYIDIVNEGILECYDETQKNLYKNTTNTLKNCEEYLKSKGFECKFSKQSKHDGNLKFSRL